MQLSRTGESRGRIRRRWAARIVTPLVIAGAGIVGQIPSAEATSTASSCFVALANSGSGSCSFLPLSAMGHVVVLVQGNAAVTVSVACTFGNSGTITGTSVVTYTHAGDCTLFYTATIEAGSVLIYAD